MHHPTRNSPEAPGAQGAGGERQELSPAACGAQALCAALLAELGLRSGQQWGLLAADLPRSALQLTEVLRLNSKSCHLDWEF